MAQQGAIVDKLLTDSSNGLFLQDFIAEKIFPFVGVVQQSGKLAKYGTGHLRIEISTKGGRGAYRRVDSIVRASDSYFIDGHGLEGLVTKDDYRNVEQPFDAEEDETLGITSILQLEKEKAVADALADTAVLTQNVTLSGTGQFSDYNNSDPLAAFATARGAIKSGCGVKPNTAILSWSVAEKLRYHPQLLDLLGFKFARPGGLADSDLATALSVERILIGASSYESAVEGQASVLADVWGKHVIFGVCPDKAIKRQVSAGYYLGYKGQAPRQVFTSPVVNPPGSTSVIVEDNYDYVLQNVGGLYLIKNAIA